MSPRLSAKCAALSDAAMARVEAAGTFAGASFRGEPLASLVARSDAARAEFDRQLSELASYAEALELHEASIIKAKAEGYEAGKADERALIVAHLRRKSTGAGHRRMESDVVIRNVADHIESGKHHEQPTEPTEAQLAAATTAIAECEFIIDIEREAANAE